MTMDLTAINSAIDAAYAAALSNPQRVMPATIVPNVTLQTDTYVAPTGSGFRVVCQIKVPEVNFTATRVRNHGPDTASEREWPIEGIETAAKGHVARCIEAGAAHVIRAGFDADKKVILLNKLLKAKETNTVADFPKLVALYDWMETVQQMAVSGNSFFPKAPYAFDEVIAE
jgi:hypothetical protein